MQELNVPCHIITPPGSTWQATRQASCVDFFIVHLKVKALCSPPECVMQGLIAPHHPVQFVIQVESVTKLGIFIERPRKPGTAKHVVGPILFLGVRTEALMQEASLFAYTIGSLSNQPHQPPPPQASSNSLAVLFGQSGVVWLKWS